MAWIELVERSVGLILAASALAKISRPGFFVARLADYAFVPSSSAWPLGLCAIAGEAATSALLLGGIADPLGLFAAAALFLAFAAVAWLVLRAEDSARRGSGADCGCLGEVLPLRLGRATMSLNLCICAICLVCGVASAIVSKADDLPTATLWGMAALLAAGYWISQFAFAVLGRMRIALDGQEGIV